MKIVIFDDDEKDLRAMTGIVERWGKQRNCKDLVFFTYDRVSSLEFFLPEIQFADLFFLDIMTPDSYNAGFRLAEKIHRSNPNANIVFTTNSAEYWDHAFDIFALHYLVKPIREARAFKVLDYVYRSPSKKGSHAAIFPGNGQELVIEFDRILYIEAQTRRHQGIVHLTDGSVQEINLSSVSFSGLLENSLSKEFAQCHRSIILNLNYVLRYDLRTVTLRYCSDEFSIGKNYRNAFLNRMIDHKKGLQIQ